MNRGVRAETGKDRRMKPGDLIRKKVDSLMTIPKDATKAWTASNVTRSAVRKDEVLIVLHVEEEPHGYAEVLHGRHGIGFIVECDVEIIDESR